MRFQNQSSSGFTLIEVLVALAILAVVATTTYKQLSVSAHQINRLETMSFGRMVSLNKLAEMRLGLVETNVSNLPENFANREWVTDIEWLEELQYEGISVVSVRTYSHSQEQGFVSSFNSGEELASELFGHVYE